MQKSLVRALLACFVGCIAFIAQAQEGALTFPAPEAIPYDPAKLADLDLSALPILPEWTETAQAVYTAGLAEGNVPKRFSKIGDCMTASASFLVPFAGEAGVDYDLGAYAELQSVIDYFNVPARDEGFERNSWGNEGLGTQSGFNTSSLTDWLFADPKWCDVNESPLECEYRVSRPSFSLMMLGTNDITFFDEAQFDRAMRTIVYTTLERRIVPVLYTFPIRPEYPEKTVAFNKIIAAIARDYDIPLINLWLAIDDLPFNGVDEKEPIHLSLPDDGKTAFLDEERLQYGYNVRNLLTLQALAGFLEAIEARGE
jgi:hypothetical protein